MKNCHKNGYGILFVWKITATLQIALNILKTRTLSSSQVRFNIE